MNWHNANPTAAPMTTPGCIGKRVVYIE